MMEVQRLLFFLSFSFCIYLLGYLPLSLLSRSSTLEWTDGDGDGGRGRGDGYCISGLVRDWEIGEGGHTLGAESGGQCGGGSVRTW